MKNWRYRLIENWQEIVKPTHGYDTARGELYCLLRDKFPQSFKQVEEQEATWSEEETPDSVNEMVEFIVDNWALTIAALNKSKGTI